MPPESSISFWGSERVLVSALLVAFLLALPWVSSRLLSRARRSPARSQKRIWVLLEALLAFSVATTFAATAATVQVTASFIAPWVWDVSGSALDLDSPLTARSMFMWMTVMVLGWSVFRWAGLNSVRDVHRSAKECMDLVSKHNPKARPRRPAAEISRSPDEDLG
jgi:hypothetical protein